MKFLMICSLVFLETMFVGSGIGVCLIIYALTEGRDYEAVPN